MTDDESHVYRGGREAIIGMQTLPAGMRRRQVQGRNRILQVGCRDEHSHYLRSQGGGTACKRARLNLQHILFGLQPPLHILPEP